ncbi:MAG: helix-turn-helix transcriptional regulator [Clostridia bacterium]|nr:helix-turn-helix transcriptional regulator [Clostridia bacterium]
MDEKILSQNDKDTNGRKNLDLKDCFAQNLIKYRKALNLTQAELAEKLNYSDKAVSKWERAESVPDIYTIKSIADFFGIKVDVLISEPRPDRPKVNYNLGKKRTILCLASTAIVWLVAIAFYAFIHIISPAITQTWLSFVYAIPVSAIVLLVFTSVWGKSLGNTIIVSVLVWSVILTVYLTLLHTLPAPPSMLWEIFLVGIPAEGVIVFWYLYRKVK